MNINLSSVPRFRSGAYGAMVADEAGDYVKVADLAAAEETHSLQCWPSGGSFTYRGDIHAPTIEVRIDGAWRTATEEEHGQIRINVLASRYADREVFCCDSALVDDLLKGGIDSPSDLREGFEYEEIRNLYADPSDWDAAQCRAWLQDKGYGHVVDCADPATCEGEQGDCPSHGSSDAVTDELREEVRDRSNDHPAEVYEWWRVSSWLCAALDSIGEVTIDNGYGHWWGRCATGQGFIMDGVLQRVAAR